MADIGEALFPPIEAMETCDVTHLAALHFPPLSVLKIENVILFDAERFNLSRNMLPGDHK